MSESKSHCSAKMEAAGLVGQTEVLLASGKRLDAKSPGRATEIERSGARLSLEAAAQRLKESRAPQKVLQVPEKDIDKAAAAMRTKRIAGTVHDMTGSKRRSVLKRK